MQVTLFTDHSQRSQNDHPLEDVGRQGDQVIAYKVPIPAYKLQSGRGTYITSAARMHRPLNERREIGASATINPLNRH